MKRTLALLMVFVLVIFAVGDTFAAKNPQTPSLQPLSPEVEAGDPQFPQGEAAPLPVRPRTSAALVPIAPGTYTIGAAGTYTSLSAAVASIMANGVDSTAVGDFIFEFIDASYTDTSQTIGPVVGQYGAGKIIFRPAAANVAAINIVGGVAANTFCVRLNNVNNMVWDGSNSGGSDRSLTIRADTTGISRNAMVIQRGSKNVTIENVILMGNRRVAANPGLDVLRIVNTGFSAFGAQNNVTIDNCNILKGSNGIFHNAATGALRDTGLVVTNNLLGNGASVDVLNALGRYGVEINGAHAPLIADNDINGLYVSIGANLPTGVHLSGNYISAMVVRNRIHNLIAGPAVANFPQGMRAANALLSAAGVRASATVSNNFVYDIHNLSTGAPARGFRGFAYTGTGAAAGLGTTINWVHNSVYIRPGSGETAVTAFMFDWSSFGGGVAGSPDTATFRNNIMTTNTSATGGFTRTYLMFTPAVAANFTQIDNNNLFYQVDFGAFAQWGAFPYPTGPAYVGSLADWRGDSGNDLLSVVGDPEFVSPTDLHINTAVGVVSAADSVGAAGLKGTDIDGGPRDPAFPDAGADEFVVTRFPIDLEATSVDYPTPSLVIAAGAPFSPAATFTNRGSATLAGAPSVLVQILDGTPAVVYTSAPSPVFVGGYDNTTSVVFGPPAVLPAGVYTIRAIAAIGGDANSSNDTVTSTLLVQTSITSGSFPYLEDFEDPSPETGGDGWLTGAATGSPNDWVIGTPAKTQLSGAHSGTKAYVTKTTGNYTDNQVSYIFAPILDLTTFTGVLLVQFYSNFQTENEWDGCVLEMSLDGGVNWTRVDSTLGTGGNYNTPSSVAWYNNDVNQHTASDIPFWSGGGAGGGTGSAEYSSADATNYVRSASAVSGLAGLPDVRFRWRFESDTSVNQEGWAVDDVSFSALPTDDIGVSVVEIPGYVGGPRPNRGVTGKTGEVLNPVSANRQTVKSLGAIVAGGSIDFDVHTQNYGANAQASYSVGLNINGAGEDSDVNTDPLDFGDVDTIQMSWATPTTGIHLAEAWTTLAGDADASNDTSSFAFEVLAPEVIFYEGFNSGVWPPAGWDTLDVDGGAAPPIYSWLPDIFSPLEGDGSAGDYYESENGTYIDDWLISPNTGSLADVSYTVDSLSFWVISPGGTFKDTMQVLVSTIDTDPANFAVLDYFEVPGGFTWTKLTYALPDAPIRHIAFRYLHYDGGPTGGGSNAIGLDDVRITTYAFANAFTVNPGSVSFGSIPVGFDAEATVEVKNTGNIALNVSSVTSDNADFTVLPGGPVTIPAGDSLDFTITYTPSAEGATSGNIIFNNDGESIGSVPDTVTVDGIGGAPALFLSLTPDSVFNEDPVKPGKSKKLAKRKKGLYPNWSNLLDETNAQGGFGPGTTESDSAGGMVIGKSYMFNAGGPGPAAKWKADKESAKVHAWVRLAKWDFKKNIGKSSTNIQKTLIDKNIGKHTGPASGLDTTTDGKFKPIFKQQTKLTPKKQNNKLFAELVALKLNIAASAMGKTPAGLGDLIFDVDGNPFDELSVLAIADSADQIMTLWQGHTQDELDSLHSAVYSINRAFVGALDTARFEAVDSTFPLGKLVLNGQVNLASVPYLKLPPMPFSVTRFDALNSEVESPEDFEDSDEADDLETMPVAARLYQNYPNPFNPSTTISFQLKEVSNVTIKVYNLLGQEVATLLNREELDGGFQEFQFDASQISSGVYFYRIDAQGIEDAGLKTVETRKMLLIK